MHGTVHSPPNTTVLYVCNVLPVKLRMLDTRERPLGISARVVLDVDVEVSMLRGGEDDGWPPLAIASLSSECKKQLWWLPRRCHRVVVEIRSCTKAARPQTKLPSGWESDSCPNT